MITFIFMTFLPGALAVGTEELLTKKKSTVLNFIVKYAIYSLIICIAALLFSNVLLGIKENYVAFLVEHVGSLIKVSIFACVAAIYLGFLKAIVEKNVGVKLEVKNKKNR